MKQKHTEIDRSAPPIAENMPDYVFPTFIKENIAGAKSYQYFNNSTPLFNLSLDFPVGSLGEQTPGLHNFMWQSVRRGANNRSYREISERVENAGAKLQIASNWDRSSISVAGLKENLDECLETLFECACSPDFPDEEIDNKRRSQISRLKQNYEHPDYLVSRAFNEAYFKGFAYGSPRSGTVKSIESLARKEVVARYESSMKRYAPVIVAAGNFDAAAITKYAEKFLGGDQLEEKPVVIENFVPKEKKLVLVNKSDAAQATIAVGISAFGYADPRYPAALVLNSFFSGSFDSRLNNLLREQLGYTYGVYSGLSVAEKAGVLTISTSVAEKNVADALRRIFDEMDKMSLGEVGEEELDRNKKQYLFKFIRGVETFSQVGSHLKRLAAFDLEDNYYENLYAKIAELKPSDCAAAARDLFEDSRPTAAVCGDTEFLTEALSEFGDAEIITIE